MAVVGHGGKFALTRYRTMRAWQTSLALLECRLATGRTHQIRVHLAEHRATRSSAIRFTCAASRRLPKPSISRSAATFSTSRAKPCTPPAWASNIPEPASRCSFEAALPADMQALLDDVEAALSGC